MRSAAAAILCLFATGAVHPTQARAGALPECSTVADEALPGALDTLALRGRLHLDEAAPCLARLAALTERTGDPRWQLADELARARRHGVLGQREPALALARSALDRAAGLPSMLAAVHVVLGELLLQDEAFGESERHLDDALARTADAQAPALRMRALLALARVQALRREQAACSDTAQQATVLAHDAFGDKHSFAALALHAGAACQRLAGEHGASIESLDRALDIERGQGELANPLFIAQLMLMRAQGLKIAGDYVRAERGYLDTLAYLREHPEPVAYQLSGTLHSLANLERDDGRVLQSLPRYEEAIDLFAKVYGPTSIRLSHAYNNYGNALGLIDRLDDAVAAYQQALDIGRTRGEDNEPSSLMPLSNMGLVRLWQKRYEEAESGFRLGLAITKGESAGSENSALFARLGLAASLWGQGRHRQAFEYAELAERDRQLAVATAMAHMSESSAMLYQESLRPGLDMAITIAYDSGDADLIGRAWNLAIAARGQVTAETAARLAFARGQTSPSIRESFGRWQRAHAREAEIRLNPSLPDHARLLREAEDALILAERNIAAAMPGAGAQFARTTVDSATALSALPDAGSILVSFASSGLRTPDEFSHPRSFERPRDVYAFSGGRKRAIRLQRLGDETSLRAQVTRWRRLVGDPRTPEARWRRTGERLRRQVLDPLLVPADGRVFFIPYGDLHQVNFAALPASPSGFLVDRGLQVHFLNHERELLEDTAVDTDDARVLAVSDPAFRRTASTAEATRANTCVDGNWTPLPGTRREVTALERLLPPGARFTSLDGDRATRTNVLSAMPGQDVIHLATHALRHAGDCADGSATPTRGASLATETTTPAGQSGIGVLILAAGDTGSDARPYLTESDIVALSLERTRWAVLSACDTALADSRTYEGAFGLRRAFHLAGARTVIMSLWRIDDEATADWMAALYGARFRDGADTPTALQQAQRAVLLGRRAAGLSDHPYYWAAFIAAGDWR